MRNRSKLHKNQLHTFKSWLMFEGWELQPTRGFYEVLRMTRKGSPILLVYTKLDAREHLTIFNESWIQYEKWVVFCKSLTVNGGNK